MKRWTWQWLALLGLAGMIFLAVDFVRAELLDPTPLEDENAIEIYHEPLYYDHFLVKKEGTRTQYRNKQV
jgi:hypothetical protein